ncbi:hypothetical protein [Allofustis seminis]|uniref:hypothetical protein n=1 Tax=Allofustis seminis TaxID=166939 RepID=UPI0014614FF0|nr:hypothetical protein [Allofustis seminis]
MKNLTIDGSLNGTGETLHFQGMAYLGKLGKLILDLQNVTAKNCKGVDGGAFYLCNATVTKMSGCHFENCVADNSGRETEGSGYGGAFYIEGNIDNLSNPQLTKFISNHARAGGAIFIAKPNDGSTLYLKNIQFNGNTALITGTPQSEEDGCGGAVYSRASGGFQATEFINNHSSRNGGALYVGLPRGGNLLSVSGNSSFLGNKANCGGAVYVEEKIFFGLSNSKLIGNVASSQGGAIYT